MEVRALSCMTSTCSMFNGNFALDGRGASSSSPYFSQPFAGIGSILSSTPKGAAARPHTLTTASGSSVAASSVVARATGGGGGGGGSTVCNGGEGIEESGVYYTSTTTTVCD